MLRYRPQTRLLELDLERIHLLVDLTDPGRVLHFAFEQDFFGQLELFAGVRDQADEFGSNFAEISFQGFSHTYCHVKPPLSWLELYGWHGEAEFVTCHGVTLDVPPPGFALPSGDNRANHVQAHAAAS